MKRFFLILFFIITLRMIGTPAYAEDLFPREESKITQIAEVQQDLVTNYFFDLTPQERFYIFNRSGYLLDREIILDIKYNSLIKMREDAENRRQEKTNISTSIGEIQNETYAPEPEFYTEEYIFDDSYVYNDNINNEYFDSNYEGDFKSAGVIYENGNRYTYYSSNVLYHYQTEEWNVGDDGIYRTQDGYVVVAGNDNEYSYGDIVDTPFGEGKVLDSGCDYGTIDIYTNY